MSAPDYSYLPGILAEIAGVAGLVAALKIADAMGGTRNNFPARARAEHPLAKLVGLEAAENICRHFRTAHKAGTYVLVPLGPKNFYQRARRQAEGLTKAGVPCEEVARRLGLHMRTVRRYRARLRDVQPPDQLTLL